MANGNPRILLQMGQIGFLKMEKRRYSGFWKEKF